MLGDELVDRWNFPPFRWRWRAYVAHGTVDGEDVVVLKPRTYMNRSGLALIPFVRKPIFDPARHLLVVVDDFALPLGTLRLRARGSAGGHNGLESIEATLASREYARLRIGVGPLPNDEIDPADFVLSPFDEHELRTVEELLPTASEATECWLREGIDTAMNRFNRTRTTE
jgi:PTH1 family peptidyl-tRNA hydrolase